MGVGRHCPKSAHRFYRQILAHQDDIPIFNKQLNNCDNSSKPTSLTFYDTVAKRCPCEAESSRTGHLLLTELRKTNNTSPTQPTRREKMKEPRHLQDRKLLFIFRHQFIWQLLSSLIIAAEALGIIASVAGLGSALLNISSAINAFAHVKKEARDLYAEVQTLYKVNLSLHQSLDSNKAKPNDQWISSANDVISGCTATVDEMQRRFENPKDKMSFSNKVSWTIKRREVAILCTQPKIRSLLLYQ
jgi:hypothetical protein